MSTPPHEQSCRLCGATDNLTAPGPLAACRDAGACADRSAAQATECEPAATEAAPSASHRRRASAQGFEATDDSDWIGWRAELDGTLYEIERSIRYTAPELVAEIRAGLIRQAVDVAAGQDRAREPSTPGDYAEDEARRIWNAMEAGEAVPLAFERMSERRRVRMVDAVRELLAEFPARVRETALLDAAAECESLTRGMSRSSAQRVALEHAAESLRAMALEALAEARRAEPEDDGAEELPEATTCPTEATRVTATVTSVEPAPPPDVHPAPVAGGFASWARVELMGYRRLIGRVQEVTLAGEKFLRIDVPGEECPHLHPPSALYGLHPCTEEDARREVAARRPAYPELTDGADDGDPDAVDGIPF